MLDGIFNDGWNLKTTIRTNPIPVDMNENDNAFLLNADFPGFDKKDVNLNIEEGVLTLSANRDLNNNSKEGIFQIRERRAGSFSRSFTLPENVIVDDISAKFKNGTLSVTIPKAEKGKPNIRQIKIG